MHHPAEFAAAGPGAGFDKETAAWLPNKEVAFVWRAWVTKKSPVVLQTATVTGTEKSTLPAWNPKKGRTLMVAPGGEVELSVTADENAAIKSVKYYEADKLIGASNTAPWTFAWKNPASGTHPVWVEWTDTAGKVHAANPALIAVKFKE